jgi:WD40 repeat protein
MHASRLPVFRIASLVLCVSQSPAANSELSGKLLAPEGGVVSVGIDPRGRWLVTGGSDDNTLLWDLK